MKNSRYIFGKIDKKNMKHLKILSNNQTLHQHQMILMLCVFFFFCVDKLLNVNNDKDFCLFVVCMKIGMLVLKKGYKDEIFIINLKVIRE